MTIFDPGRDRAANEFPVNGELIKFDDAIIRVREALNAAGLTPASEHQAVMIENGRTTHMTTDARIVLADHPDGQLRAVLSDEASAFTVNEIGQIWPTDQIETDEFNQIWPAPEGQDWVLERKDEPDVVLRPGNTIAFGPKGVEHIVSRKHHGADKLLVTVMTLSGVFPAEGGLRVKSDETISSVLEKAARKLDLADTSGWVVSLAGNDINASLTFGQAGLTGTVELDWMPREGGGGNA